MKSLSLRLCVILLLAFVLSLTMVACQGDESGEQGTSAATETGESTQGNNQETNDVVDGTTAGTEDAVATDAATENGVSTESTVITEAVTEMVTEEMTEAITEEATRGPLEWETFDASLSSVIDPADVHVVDPSQWVAVDGLGRVLPTNTQTGDAREDKTVAIFYWTWHGQFANEQHAYNNQNNLDILLANGYTEQDYFTLSIAEMRRLGIYTVPAAQYKYHFWNEPIFGYYDGDDEWVIRKHAEMLATAGVDVVFFDNTNGTFTWLETAMKVMKVFSEARTQGVKAPYVSFMLPFGPGEHSGTQMVQLYTQIYEKELYKDVWYMLDGKPMLMAWPGSFNLDNPTHAQYHETIRNFFTFRSNVGDYKDKTTATDFWGWLSVFPQQIYYNSKGDLEQITVGTAINHNYVDGVIAPMNGQNIIGRTWTSKGYDTRENAMLYGACFAEQWENAIATDPNVVFVTAWNEWVAMKHAEWPALPGNPYTNCFVDQYNDLYSRDCEPTTGILKDHYYYQLISYIREFKGTNPIEVATPEKLIDINAGYGQWANVGPVYNDYFGLTDRDFDGYKDPTTNKPFHYTNTTGRNDIYDAKVARDYENIYFMVRTLEDLTPYTDEDWMRLYISAGDSDENWEGYEFVLNKTNPTATEATLERFTGNGYETSVVGKVAYTVKGNVMMVCIPKTMLGIAADQYEFTFDFKWVDNANEDENGDIMQWYANGDVAPIGRFNFCYTTSAFAENEKRPAYGWQKLDLTNAENQNLLKESLAEEGSVVGMTYAFDEKGLTLTSTAPGANTKIALDYTKAPARITGDGKRYVAITYVCNENADGKKLSEMRLGWSMGINEGVAENPNRAKAFKVTADGQEHTVVLDMTKARDWKGRVFDMYIYFGKTELTEVSITISSIEFFEENPSVE